MYWTIYGIVIFAGLAMMVREGLWSNTIMLVNILISGLVAFGFYSPLVIYLDELSDGKHTYWLDFPVIWALFVVAMLICRAFTSAASKTRLRFKNPIDPVGGPLIGLMAAWVLAGFTTATLHMSPMPKDAFNGKLVYADVASQSAVTSPDAAWLRFFETMSQPVALGSSATIQFDANTFIKIYQQRREKFEKATSMIVSRG
jgi:hypothetical protein